MSALDPSIWDTGSEIKTSTDGALSSAVIAEHVGKESSRRFARDGRVEIPEAGAEGLGSWRGSASSKRSSCPSTPRGGASLNRPITGLHTPKLLESVPVVVLLDGYQQVRQPAVPFRDT
jgi:hypothetical protein